jgi:hypothetical protein
MLNRESARWKTSPLKNWSPPYVLPLLDVIVPPKVLDVAVAGVLGNPIDIAIEIPVGGADVGIVACAAGPRAAERGVAGSGDVTGDGPCIGRSGAVTDVADKERLPVPEG